MISSETKRKRPPFLSQKSINFIPKSVSEIRNYYRKNSKKMDYKEDFQKNSQNNKLELNSNKKAINLYSKKRLKSPLKVNIFLENKKEGLNISSMSSIKNDEIGNESLILDQDIEEHGNDAIILRSFIKKDSKLKSPPINSPCYVRSLNTTNNFLNMTQKLFNSGYYSEETENQTTAKGKRKMYESVKELIRKQQEHLQIEYKKLQSSPKLFADNNTKKA